MRSVARKVHSANTALYYGSGVLHIANASGKVVEESQKLLVRTFLRDAS